MKKFILIAIFSLIFLPLAAMGQTSDSSEDQATDTVVEAEEVDNLEGTTRGNRRDSFLYVGISPFGIHIPTLLTAPISLGIFMGESLYVGGELGVWDINYTDSSDTSIGSYTNVGGVFRYFTGNSFYFSTALHYRAWAVDVSYDYSGTTGYGHLEASSLVGSVGLGNQWITDIGFTFGIEYLVLSGALSSSVDATVTDDGGGSAAEADAELISVGEFLNEVSAWSGFLIFSFGWSF